MTMKTALAAVSYKSGKVWADVSSAPGRATTAVRRSLCKHLPILHTKKARRKYQPQNFAVESAIIWTDRVSIDITDKFIKAWANEGFGILVMNSLQEYGADPLLAVTYRYRKHELYMILFHKTAVYPPYSKKDTRIPRLRFLRRDVAKAVLVKENRQDQFEGDNPTVDVTELLLKLRGPGGLFYADTAYHVEPLFAKLFKRMYTEFAYTLRIEFTDATVCCYS